MESNARQPKLGDDVHFILNAGPNAGAHRAAKVVGKINDEFVNLQVFSDGTIRQGDCCPNLFWVPSVRRDDGALDPGTWHFEER